MCGKPGKGRHGTSHHAKVKHISNIKSFLPVKGEISITKVWTDGQTDGRTDGLTDNGQGDCNIAPSLRVGV